MTIITLRDVKPHDRVELVFKPTSEARQALARLWAMHEDTIFVSTGARPSIEEELWTGEGCEGWESALIRTFCFSARAPFNGKHIERELGEHIETIAIKN